MFLTPASYAEAITDVLQRKYGAHRNATKIVSQLAGVSPGTARNWLDGICAPQGAALLNLMANCKDVDEEVSRLKFYARKDR